jgi:hypothetical protein
MYFGFRTKRSRRQPLRKLPGFRPQVMQLDERVLLSVTVQVDAGAGQHAINPLIYGVNNSSQGTLTYLGATADRAGGNADSTYNYLQNAENSGNDFFFESHSSGSADQFITNTKAAGAQPIVTVPMLPYVAKLGPGGQGLSSFSVAKYGAQTASDGDAGSGILANGTPITNNDPNDAYVASNVQFQQGWIQHLVDTFGSANNGGVKYYGLDNEPSIWFEAHRDVTPQGLTMDQELQNLKNYGAMVKTVDPTAEVEGPEEWGWDGFIYSGADQQYIRDHNFNTNVTPDRTAHGGMDYIPYLLQQLKQYQQDSGIRALDTLTVHFYPQGGPTLPADQTEFNAGESNAADLLRNQSTRSLWDPNYVDVSYINTQVQLIPRLKNWVSTYYPGTKIGLTEYNWGNIDHMNGATSEADVLGILGREGGVSLANLWDEPDSPANPTDATEYPGYQAIKLYRNYDGAKSAFGETSVSATTPNPDQVSAFSSIRSSDGALTIMVDNKNLYDPAHPGATTSIQIDISNFSAAAKAQVWQLAAINPSDQTQARISQLGDVSINGNILTFTVPQESVTLLVIKPAAQATVPQIAMVSPASAASGSTIILTGSHFTGATAVTFEAGASTTPAANFVVNSDTQITATVPTQGTLPNLVDIFVTSAAGKSTQSATDQFTFSPGQANPGKIEFVASTQSVNEDAGTILVTLTRTGGSDGAVSVHYATTDGTATDGVDYNQTSGTVSFAAGQTSKSFNVTILNPGKFGGSTSFQITLSNPTGGATLGATNSLTVTIADTLPAQPIPSNLGVAALMFTHSSEAFGYFVTQAYQRFLNRTPDDGGIAFWVDKLQHGLTDEQLEAGFADSPEFFSVNGGTNEGLIRGMYATLLLRNPDQAGLDYWVGQLDAGISPAAVAFGFTASPERETIRITDDYMTYLGRQPDDGGLAFWLDAFLHGARNEDLVAGFVGSPEYYAAEGKGNNNRAAWTANAYQAILHRAATPGEIQGWEAFFNQG